MRQVLVGCKIHLPDDYRLIFIVLELDQGFE